MSEKNPECKPFCERENSEAYKVFMQTEAQKAEKQKRTDEMIENYELAQETILELKERIEELEAELAALKHTVVVTIGGTDYEGFPTSEINYLQRLRILLEKERQLAALKPKWQTGKPVKFGRYICEGFYLAMTTRKPYQFLVEWFEGEWNQRFCSRWAGPLEPPEE